MLFFFSFDILIFNIIAQNISKITTSIIAILIISSFPHVDGFNQLFCGVSGVATVPATVFTFLSENGDYLIDDLSKIEIYNSNNEKIKETKKEIINIGLSKWWLYFGK